MDIGRIISLIFGNTHNRDVTLEKLRFNSRFYAHMDEDESSGEVIFCKNNVCVYNGHGYIPGYLTLKACTINEDYTRLMLHWTSNSQLQENFVENDMKPVMAANAEQPEVFHIDLCDMKTIRFFFESDLISGHFVVGNHENHYKVFHFDLAGMNHLSEIFDNWSLCKRVQLPKEETRKKSYTVIPIYFIQPDQSLEESRYRPMTKGRWQGFFNALGQLEDVANFRKEVFFGGILPEVRHEAWPFLLHYYPYHSRISERKQIKEEKTTEYNTLNEKRLNMPKDKYDKFWLSVQCTVDKDVVRTDRSHPYFSGNDNPNIGIMRKILLNFAVHQPDIGYNQGMSDLVASILCTIQDEVDAFWCFVGLMKNSVFVTSPKDDSMDGQLLYLKELLRMMAAKFYAHLLLEDDNMDLLFCHRWLLLGFKREFYDVHVMRMWEACWCHYQTHYFHIFLCVAIVVEYGDEVWSKNMKVDETLNYFNNMALQMDGDKILRKARSLLHQFRQLATIPCTLRGLLSGPGVWDSATLPEIECNCHNIPEGGCLHGSQVIKKGEPICESHSDTIVSSSAKQPDMCKYNDTTSEVDTSTQEYDTCAESPTPEMTGSDNMVTSLAEQPYICEYNDTTSEVDTSTQEYDTCAESPTPEVTGSDNMVTSLAEQPYICEYNDTTSEVDTSTQEYDTCAESPTPEVTEMVPAQDTETTSIPPKLVTEATMNGEITTPSRENISDNDTEIETHDLYVSAEN